jgi:hypothetical protein
VSRLLRPLIRLLLEHGMAFAEFTELARSVYVQVADQDFALPGRKQTDSRVSVITGLTRKEVSRLRGTAAPSDAESGQSYNRAARVVSAWVREYPMEGTASGVTPLPLDGPASLADLVRRYSGDMPVRAVVDELMRVGAIRIRDSGEVELQHRHYLPPPGEKRKLVYLGDDVADLISTITHNLAAKKGETLFQRKVYYDNIPDGHMNAVRTIARQRGEALIDTLVHDMGAHDRDVRPKLEGEGRNRAVVGIYYHEQVFIPESPGEAPPAKTKKGKRK